MESKEFKARVCWSTIIKVAKKISLSKSQILKALNSLRSEAIIYYHPERGHFAGSLLAQERKRNLNTSHDRINSGNELNSKFKIL
jgi:hypothetical protein